MSEQKWKERAINCEHNFRIEHDRVIELEELLKETSEAFEKFMEESDKLDKQYETLIKILLAK